MVYEAYAPRLRSLVARFFDSAFEREEATQEIWLHVHRNRQVFDPERGELGAWLYKVAGNRCKELVRAKGRRIDPSDTLGEEALVAPDNPEADAATARARGTITDFLHTLPPDQARIFELSFLEDHTLEEVAATLGVPLRRIKYLRSKIFARAVASRELRAALLERPAS